MIRSILVVIGAIAVVIFGLSVYLAPNDLAGCAERPELSSPCARVDAIVAVSGGDTSARTEEAIKLYQNGWAGKLIFSGAAYDKSGPSNAEVMRREAREAGVPDDHIITEEYSATTKENAELTQSIFEDNNIRTAILVTSAYHQRRAGLEFSKRSPNVVFYNHPVASDNQWSSWWWLTPQGWALSLSEFFKIALFYVGISR